MKSGVVRGNEERGKQYDEGGGEVDEVMGNQEWEVRKVRGRKWFFIYEI